MKSFNVPYMLRLNVANGRLEFLRLLGFIFRLFIFEFYLYVTEYIAILLSKYVISYPFVKPVHICTLAIWFLKQ